MIYTWKKWKRNAAETATEQSLVSTDELMNLLRFITYDDDDTQEISLQTSTVPWDRWLNSISKSSAKLYIHTGIDAVFAFILPQNSSPTLLFVHPDSTCTEITRRWNRKHYTTAHYYFVEGWKKNILPWQFVKSNQQKAKRALAKDSTQKMQVKTNKNSDDGLAYHRFSMSTHQYTRVADTAQQDCIAGLPEPTAHVIVRYAVLHDLEQIWECSFCSPYWYDWRCFYCLSWNTFHCWTPTKHYGNCGRNCGCCRTRQGEILGCNTCETLLNLKATARHMRALLQPYDRQ